MREIIGVTTRGMSDMKMFADTSFAVFFNSGDEFIFFNILLSEVIYLIDILDSLNKNGRFAVLTFHSLEDRIVKQKFKELATGCICPPDFPICVCGHKATVKLITKHPVEATDEELKRNPRSAPAKLRVIEKL